MRWIVVGAAAAAWPAPTWAAEGGDLGGLLPLWSAVPFVGMLLSIALLPLFAPAFWHRSYGRVAAAWAAILVVPFVLAHGAAAVHELAHVAILDYVPFIILLATLFTVGGGIHLGGTLRGTPLANASLLAVGTVLASWIGTTGATMLLIRPLLRANRARRYRTHTVVFFIFLVANVGGALTPLGDPPLFLGFLHGVPFFWTLTVWRETLLTATWVLGTYLVVELHCWRREDPQVRERPPGGAEPLHLEGWHNAILLAGVLAAVVASGVWHGGEVSVLGVHQQVQNLVRDTVLLCLLAASWLTTPRRIREANEFTWGPIREVAILFAGIFATIMPALAMLRAGERGALAAVIRAVHEPAHFFWASGGLSSFLDNAPTYLTFLSTALGRLYPGVEERIAIQRLIAEHPAHLQAIATGSVFMGANTYIGNAPNFMVKSIAEEAGVPMPSFFGYILRYTMPVLLPAFLVATYVFFP
jgi:Na+/H+ antiporter NhaD/arsenite permease-like protein